MFPEPKVKRFLKRYIKLINHYRTSTITTYEKHHILPKCLGGNNDKNNLIKLPPKAHFLAHYFLCKAYPDDKKLKHAFAMMIVCNPYQSRPFTGAMYEQAKRERSNALKGVPRPEWVKEKLRKPKHNKQNYKKPKSETHKKSIGLSLKGRIHKTSTCIHCNTTAAAFNISRWHNDNCKSIRITSEDIHKLSYPE
jgi:hypothetical protein